MVDNRTPIERRRNMQAVKQRNTAPELHVRKLLHSHGYRYRLHIKELPGKPDLVFLGKKKVIFVHGCFWHRHNCKHKTVPKSGIDYWDSKLQKNSQRDAKNIALLEAAGWQVFVVWECELKSSDLLERLRTFLDAQSS